MRPRSVIQFQRNWETFVHTTFNVMNGSPPSPNVGRDVVIANWDRITCPGVMSATRVSVSNYLNGVMGILINECSFQESVTFVG